MTQRNAVLWIDQTEAKIFHFDSETFTQSAIESPHRHVRRHADATHERAHPADAQHAAVPSFSAAFPFPSSMRDSIPSFASMRRVRRRPSQCRSVD